MTETEMLRAQVDSLTKQLVAATNDAARAELRAKDLREAIAGVTRTNHCEELCAEAFQLLHGALQKDEAAPDSDARLREVMEKVAKRAADLALNFAFDKQDRKASDQLKALIDDVLRGAPITGIATEAAHG